MNGAIIRSLIVGLVMAASILEGCTQKDWQLLREWRDEWMEEHNLRVTDDQGEFDLGRAIGAGINYVVSERDPEVEAVMNAYTVIDNINRSDKLMEEGRNNRDPDKMDQAIQNRPGDWTYRTSRGALAIEYGDVTTAQQQFAAADAIVQQGSIDPVWYANQGISDLQSIPGAEHINYGAPCRAYYEQISYYQAVLHQSATDPQEKARAMAAWQDAQAKLKQCK